MLVVGAACLSVAMVSTRAGAFDDGHKLLDLATSDEATLNFGFTGYVHGVLGTLLLFQATDGTISTAGQQVSLCLPDDFTVKDVADHVRLRFRQFQSEAPGILDLPAATAVASVLVGSFHCDE